MSRSIIVDTVEGPVLVEGIPDDAKITFGPMTPGSKNSYDYAKVLRIYTSVSNQLAVFVGVTAFRDLSLTIKKRKVTSKGKAKRIKGPDGSMSSVYENETYEWVEDDSGPE